MEKDYLITIKGNDVFASDWTITAESIEELLTKIQAIINSLQKRTIEKLHIESVILL